MSSLSPRQAVRRSGAGSAPSLRQALRGAGGWRLGADTGVLARAWREVAALAADKDWIGAQLAYQGAFTPELDDKARAAHFVVDYSHRLALVLARLFVGFGLVPPLAPASVAVRSRWLPVLWQRRLRRRQIYTFRFLVPDAVGATGDATGLRLGLEAHFAPLIEALQRASGLSRQAMWRLVGDSVAAAFLDAGRRAGVEAEAKAAALAILKHPGSPLANRQLHFFDIVLRDPARPDRVLASRSYRARGGCCRYYVARPGMLCSTCVLKDPVRRDRDLEAGLRRRLGLPPLLQTT